MLQPEVYTVHMLDYKFLVEDKDIHRQTESSHHGPPQVPQSVRSEARKKNYVKPVKLHLYLVQYTNTCRELQQQRPLPGRQGSCRGSSSTGPSSQARNTQTWASPQYPQRSGSVK